MIQPFVYTNCEWQKICQNSYNYHLCLLL